MTQLSTECGILNISQPYRPPQPVPGIVIAFYRTTDIIIVKDIAIFTFLYIR
jgi:hypothetical protein